MDIPVYPVTPGEKKFLKENYPGWKHGQVNIEHVQDCALPKKIIEQYIDQNSIKTTDNE
ncbi:MAG: hypothetical protein HXS53_06670 [Theionarchaea archaeon]|nr:hypothetical protein [Theionarchaea archaeon]